MTTALPEMVCQEFVEHVSDYLDGTITGVDRQRLELHLSVCSKCGDYLRQLATTLELVGHLREADVTPAMEGELMDVFARWRAGQAPPARGGG